MGDGEGQVASGQNDALIKGKVARQRRRLGSTTTAAPGQAPSVDVVGGVPSDGKHEEGVGEEGEERKKQKGEGSQLVGGSARQGGRNLLFRKVSRLLLSQRAASFLRQKPKRGRGSASLCPQTCVLVFSQGPGEVQAETSDEFCENF